MRWCVGRWRRYVCEDRYTAIRWAIAAAQKGDVVVVAGKGDQDWTEVSDGRGGSIRVCSFADTGVMLSQGLIHLAVHVKSNLASHNMLIDLKCVPPVHA